MYLDHTATAKTNRTIDMRNRVNQITNECFDNITIADLMRAE